jgi:hypothetical protein
MEIYGKMWVTQIYVDSIISAVDHVLQRVCFAQSRGLSLLNDLVQNEIEPGTTDEALDE